VTTPWNVSSERRVTAPVSAQGGFLGRSARTAQALLAASRPQQWTKNLLVLAAPAAAGILTHSEVPGKLAVTFTSFCMLSSAVYLLNDVHDRDEDRRHPVKRSRPVASGQLSVTQALVAAAVLAVVGLGLAAAIRPQLLAVAAGYLALTVSYTLWWREVAVADIAAVAGGFVLRALAGGVATSVPVSRWFLVVTSFGALFLVTGKRYAELREHPDKAGARAPLAAYSASYLRFVLGLSATITTMSYCLWALQKSHAARLSWYELTVVPMVLWLLRYALLLEGGGGESPERLMFSDRFLLIMSATWVALFICGVYVAS
jgi:decaprenyl-phosphate phosphoribosyltransferase